MLEGKRVLARAPITVTDVVATLDAPETVAARQHPTNALRAESEINITLHMVAARNDQDYWFLA